MPTPNICNSLYESSAVTPISDGLTQLFEATFGNPSQRMGVDREKQVISGVKCLGRESKNGRLYSDQALEDARRFYEGIDVNLDHPPGDSQAERRMVDGFGVLRNVRTLAEGVFADLHYLGSHPMAEVIAERAEKFPGNFGMSHNATGRVREDPASGKLTVEGLEAVESVDIVRRPATNKGLFESESETRRQAVSNDKGKAKKTVRQVLEAHPKDKQAAALLLLLESEEFKTAGDAVLESGDAPKDALCALLAESFKGDVTIEAAAARAKKLLEGKAEETTDPPAGSIAAIVKAAVAEAVAPLRAEQAKRDLEDAKRSLLESKGLLASDLNAAQRKVLARAENVEAAEDFLESWNVRPAAGVSRPAINSRRLAEPDGDAVGYEDLKKQIRPKAPAA